MKNGTYNPTIIRIGSKLFVSRKQAAKELSRLKIRGRGNILKLLDGDPHCVIKTRTGTGEEIELANELLNALAQALDNPASPLGKSLAEAFSVGYFLPKY